MQRVQTNEVQRCTALLPAFGVVAKRADDRPLLPEVLPAVGYRIGVDLAPVDVQDDTAIRWLRALIWPEHIDRAKLLEQAVQIARLNPPSIVAGNAADILPQILSNIPSETVLCVNHSYTLNQCSQTVREKILDSLIEFAQKRDLFRISLEWCSGQEQPHLELFTYQAGIMSSELLAYCESHGRTIEWLQFEEQGN